MLVQTTLQASPASISVRHGAPSLSPAVFDVAHIPNPASSIHEPPYGPQSVLSVQSIPTPTVSSVLASSASSPPPSLVSLNNERQAFTVKEFDAFIKRHVRPAQQTFLDVSMPNMKQLHDGLAHIFHPLPSAEKEFMPAQSQERLSEISRWIQGIQQFVEGGGHRGQSKGLVELIIALNEAVDKSGDSMRGLFYRASDRLGLLDALERLSNDSKSVRVVKEVEEFQDAREEWDEKRA